MTANVILDLLIRIEHPTRPHSRVQRQGGTRCCYQPQDTLQIAVNDVEDPTPEVLARDR
jgi:hypothetical protein